MDFFYTTKVIPIDVNKGTNEEHKLRIEPITEQQAKTGSIPNNLLHVATLGCIANIQQTLHNMKYDAPISILNTIVKNSICQMPNFPINLSNFDLSLYHEVPDLSYRIPNTAFIPLKDRIQPLLDKGLTKVKVMILNGIGTGIGDSVIGVTALRLFHIELSKYFKEVVIDLYQTPFNRNATKAKLYAQEKFINSNNILPVSLNQLLEYDCVSDFSAMVIRENFDTYSMIDFFLENLAIDPKTIPDEHKRNFIKLNDKTVAQNKLKFIALENNNCPNLMIHGAASVAIRSMSKDTLTNFVKYFLENTNYNIVLTSLPNKITVKHLNKIFNTNRIVDFTSVSNDLDEFVYTISKMDYIVTVDTCVYHIADAFSINTVALFVSIDPNIRTNYYPSVTPIVVAKNHKLWGLHGSSNENDEGVAHQLWKGFNPALIIDALNSNTYKIKYENCPVCLKSSQPLITDKYKHYNLKTCKHCESEYTDNRTADDYDAMYQHDYNHYIEQRTREENIYGYINQMRFTEVRKFLQNDLSSKKVLDVGCANGFFVGYCTDLGFDAYGIDISRVAIDYGIKNLGLLNKIAQCADLNNLPDNFYPSYDIITSFEVVEHLPNPNFFAKQVFSTLNEGGVWMFSTPNRNRIQFGMGVKNTSKHTGIESGDYPPEHLTRFTLKGHEILAKDAGFEIIYQDSTKLLSNTVEDLVGPFPQLTVHDAETNRDLSVDHQAVNNAIAQYYQNMTDAVHGYGNFITTFCYKPKSF